MAQLSYKSKFLSWNPCGLAAFPKTPLKAVTMVPKLTVNLISQWQPNRTYEIINLINIFQAGYEIESLVLPWITHLMHSLEQKIDNKINKLFQTGVELSKRQSFIKKTTVQTFEACRKGNCSHDFRHQTLPFITEHVRKA